MLNGTKVMEKTLESLQRVLSVGSSRSVIPLLGTRRRFDEFVEHTRFAFSKHEEDLIVRNKLASLQSRLSQPGISLDEVEDCLLYAMYCETIGYSCSFAYIHSLKLAEQGNLHQKMIGYLAAITFLHQHHELVVLLINTIQKGVKSSNIIEVCLALTAICHLVSSDMVPSVQCLIEEKLNHPHPMVRRYAILALQHCLMHSQNWHISLAALPKIQKALMDKDLSVVTAGVTVVKELIKV